MARPSINKRTKSNQRPNYNIYMSVERERERPAQGDEREIVSWDSRSHLSKVPIKIPGQVRTLPCRRCTVLFIARKQRGRTRGGSTRGAIFAESTPRTTGGISRYLRKLLRWPAGLGWRASAQKSASTSRRRE